MGFAEQEYDGYLVKFNDDVAVTASMDSDGSNSIEPIYPDENIFSLKNTTDDYIDYLKSNSDVEYVEPDYLVSFPENDNESVSEHLDFSDIYSLSAENSFGFETPNDPLFANQWNLKLINASSAWENQPSSSVKIGVIDSGDPSGHPDISSNILTGMDLTETGLYDTFGHSSMVCGIIGANTNNCFGVSGIIPNCEIVPIKAFSNSTTNLSKVLSGINTAIKDYNCTVINLSLTTDSSSSSLNTVIQDAVKNGVIFIAAVGNAGTSAISYPAGNDNVIGVGSINQNKTKAGHSQYNTSVDVVAPGLSVYGAKITATTTTPYKYTYGYTYGSGTSYASPHVTAAAAIAKQLKPNITASEFETMLSETCQHLGDEGKNTYYGYGLLDIDAIIKYLSPSITPLPTSLPQDMPELYVSGFIPVLTSDLSTATATITIKNTGDVKTLNVYVAAYSDEQSGDNSFQNITSTQIFSNKTIASNNTLNLSTKSLSIDTTGDKTYIKIMVWDESMKPLMEPYVYEIKK